MKRSNGGIKTQSEEIGIVYQKELVSNVVKLLSTGTHRGIVQKPALVSLNEVYGDHRENANGAVMNSYQ